MKILVCISSTPDTTAKISFSADNTQFNTAGVQYIINPYDEWYALVRALELQETIGGTVTLINVGPATNDAIIRKGLAIGAENAIRIDAAPLSSMFVAFQIATYAKDKGFDLILLGKETIDYNGGEVGSMLAEYLDLPFISNATSLNIEGAKATVARDIEGGSEEAEVELPLVLSASKGMAEQRIPNMKGIMMANRKPLEVIPAATFDESSLVVSYELPPAKTAVKMIDPNDMDELVRLLHEEAKVL
ncbi:MAG: electron transfer flavoprotein subunit beta/FixA family protein [Saprospiraceae bacterium]|nr:electron transfer flavoprotein subunit beta/FixA family protein [Saprospiraceae bacterium]